MAIQLTPAQVKLLAIHVVRDLATLRAVESRLVKEMWDYTETFEWACCKVAIQGYRASGGITPREMFEVQLKACLKREHSGHGMTEENIDRALHDMFEWRADAVNFALIKPILEEFLVARQIASKMSALMVGEADYSETIREMSVALQKSQLSSAVIEDLMAASEGDIFASMERTMTGCTPFDTLIGGIYPGQTIGLLGPMKGGKTSFLQSITADMVRTPGRRVTYITYEEGTMRLLPKMIISSINRHHREKMEGKKNHEMEPDIRSDFEKHRRMIAGSVSLVDMSGTYATQGLGGAAEMVTTIENLHKQDKLGQLVIVDHVLPMARAFINANNLDFSSALRHTVADCCNQFKSVCERLNVTGILAHQMDAKGNTSHRRVPTHMDSAECKLFAEVLHDTMCLGKKNDKNLAWLNLSATRTTEEKKMWVHVAGYKCRIQTPNKTIVTDKSGDPISADEAEHGRLGVDDRGEPVRQARTFAKPAKPGDKMEP